MQINDSKPTLAIYGIKDIKNYGYAAFVHDHNMAFFYEGKLVKYCQLERISRKKYDNSMDTSIYDLLKEEGLLGLDFDIVFVDNVIGRAFIGANGELRFEAPLVEKLVNGIEKGACWWFGERKDAYILNHELAHVYSCLPFFGNFKENSLLLHFDGGASLSNYSAWVFKNNSLSEVEYGWDLKYLSSFFNANALSFSMLNAKEFDQHSVPGKLMGFASFGSYSEKFEEWLVEHEYFQDIWKKKSVFFEEAERSFGIQLNHFDQKNSFLQDIAATFQYIFKRDFIKKLKELKDKTGAEYFYFTGGSALNILTNSEIVNSHIFKEVFIPPCCNDSGLSIGAGAYLEHLKHKEITIHTPYLNNWGIENERCEYTHDDVVAVADFLIEEKVIGVCNDYGECGPRALGNRSILALANSKKLAKKVSEEHKKREWYRPVAPVMLEKNAKYFTGLNKIDLLSKYMLFDFKIKEDKIKEIEGVVHVDRTSRIQTVFDRDDNPFLFDLLTELDEKHGVKALINTSFNVKGEPIVHTKENALISAKNMKLDGVVINGKLNIL